jgi:phosphate:Na+ symporter
MISAVTDNRLMAVGIGATVTSMIQSSSITTVIVVGLVNSGVMLLHQSIGVIMGANIGTTITGWVLVLPIAQYGLPIIGVAAFFHLFSKGDRPRFIALTALGLGLVFFGLTLMKDGFAPMREVDTFRDALAWFDATTYFGVFKCIAVGCIVTFIVQSSTATLGLTIGLAATGVIPFHTAAALVLGENVGTTITAWLASLGATTDARRAAWSHVLFNLIGAAWVSIIFPWFVPAVAWFVRLFEMGDPLTITPATASSPAHCAAVITAGIAATHTLFNLANLLLFLPFIRSFARLLKWIIPETAVVTPATLTHLDIRLVESPMIAIAQSRSEILRMGDGVLEMLDWTADLLRLDHIDESIVQRVFQREQLMDDIEQSIINFMTELLTGTVPHDVAEEGREQLRIADELESVSDYIASVVKQHLRLRKTGLRLTPTEHERRMDLHHLVRDYVEFVVEALRRADRSALDRAHRDGDRITQRFKELREIHLQKLTEDKINPTLSMSYMTMLSDYRRIKDHAENIIEALAGHK